MRYSSTAVYFPKLRLIKRSFFIFTPPPLPYHTTTHHRPRPRPPLPTALAAVLPLLPSPPHTVTPPLYRPHRSQDAPLSTVRCAPCFGGAPRYARRPWPVRRAAPAYGAGGAPARRLATDFCPFYRKPTALPSPPPVSPLVSGPATRATSARGARCGLATRSVPILLSSAGSCSDGARGGGSPPRPVRAAPAPWGPPPCDNFTVCAQIT